VDEDLRLNTSESEGIPLGKLDVAGEYCVEDSMTEAVCNFVDRMEVLNTAEDGPYGDFVFGG